MTSIIIPLGRHLRFYVINFRKLIIDTDTKSLFSLRMADMHVYIYKEVKKNVKNVFLSMCDVNMFLTFTSLNMVLL